MRMHNFTLVALLGSCIVAGGCATPKPVLELASQGVAIAGKTESELDDFANRTQRLYVQRLGSLQRLARSDIDAKAATEFENYTAQRAGMSAQTEMMKLIRELADYRAQIRENALKEKSQMESNLAAPDPIKVPKEKLAELKKALAQLSQELSDREWLEFSINFGKQVNESRKEAKESADKAENKASTKEDKLKETSTK